METPPVYSSESIRATLERIEKMQLEHATTRAGVQEVDDAFENFKKKFGEVMDAGIESLRRQMQGAQGGTLRPGELVDEAMVAQVLRRSKRVVVLTGAGVSSESGIPTFRGEDGYWTVGSQNYQPQELATWGKFNEMPSELWRWYQYRWGICRKAHPNAGHHALVQLHDILPGGISIVTQNIDGLHIEAGSDPERLYEVHGNIHHMRCDEKVEGACLHGLDLDKAENLARARSSVAATPEPDPEESNETLPLCTVCGVRMRPKVLWFDECYNEAIFKSHSAMRAVDECDLLLVVGTQLTTNLPSRMVNCVRSKKGPLVIKIDPMEDDLQDPGARGMLHLRAKSGEALPRIVNALRELFKEPVLAPLGTSASKAAPAPKASPTPSRTPLSRTSTGGVRGRSPGGGARGRSPGGGTRSPGASARRSGSAARSSISTDGAAEGFFVYGTLRPDDDSGAPWTTSFAEGLTAETAWLPGASLYVDSFPVVCLEQTACVVRGMFLSSDSAQVMEDKLVEADKIEGYPDLYDRSIVNVRCRAGVKKAYVYHRTGRVDRENLIQIPDGDWLSRPRSLL